MLNRTRLSSLDAFGLRDQRNRIYPALEASDGSTLSLDFTQMSSLDSSRFTFSRATGGGKVGTATYIDGNGYVATASANVPRFAFNPTTLAPLGLMMEGNATNLSRYSETLETTGGFWGYNAATRTVESSDVNPTGGTGSISFAPSSNGGSRYAGIFLTGQTAASIYTYSVWLKGKGTTACVISIQSSAGGQNATMTILSQPAGANASITGNGTGFPRISNLSTTGWTKVQVVLSANLGGTGTLNVFMYPNDTSSQTTADSLYAWGAQLEAGTGATSYIPTTTASVSRAADQLTMSDISTLGYNTAAGTFYYSGQFTQSNTASYPVRIGFMTAGDQPTWEVFTNSSRLFATARGTGAAPEANLAFTLNTATRFAASFDASLSTAEVKINLNGSSASAGPTSLSATFTPTRLVIGRTGYEDYFPAGTIAQIKYWPTLKTAAELNLLTTT